MAAMKKEPTSLQMEYNTTLDEVLKVKAYKFFNMDQLKV